MRREIKRVDPFFMPANTPPPRNYVAWVLGGLLAVVVLWTLIGLKRASGVDEDFKAYLAAHPQPGYENNQDEWMRARPEKSRLITLFLANPFRGDVSVNYVKSNSIASVLFTARRLNGEWRIENIVPPDPEKQLI